MGDQALVHRERVTVRGFIDHGGPGARDEVLVEFLASGEERIVPRDSLCPTSDLVQGMRATGEVYLAGGRFDLAESLAVATHSPEGFWWGNVGRAATQLGLALLLRATDRDTALAHYVAFTGRSLPACPRPNSSYPWPRSTTGSPRGTPADVPSMDCVRWYATCWRSIRGTGTGSCSSTGEAGQTP